MAPLYKRYIPPKPSLEQKAPSVRTTAPHTSQSPSADVEKKRKRERTQDEIAERKAKKLKKKGIDPSLAPEVASPSIKEYTVSDQLPVQDSVVPAEEATLAPAQGEFAHIKSAKKRHKLEKEARKSRKDADKAAKLDRIPEANGPGCEPVAGDEKETPIKPGHNEGAGEATTDFSKRKKRRRDHEAEHEARKAQSEPGKAVRNSNITLHKDALEGHSGMSEAAPQPQKQRHKLETVLADVPTGEPQADDVDHLRKHTNILDKFQKSAQRAAIHPEREPQVDHPEVEQNVVEELEIPQKAPSPTPEFQSIESTLPSWLAKPTVVSTENQASFGDIGIDSDALDRLTKLGFGQALPVQQALVPLLLPPDVQGSKFPPKTEAVLPDIAVSAPTGSGKTIAYLLPITEALRRRTTRGRLSALIVVPTRELVLQVAAIADSLVKGCGVKVGMAIGTGKFVDEQAKLIHRGRRYDPETYRQLMSIAKMRVCPPSEDSSEFQAYLESIEQEDSKDNERTRDAVAGLAEHVPTYCSAVDILVATPGRLLEHISHTLGFNLSHLEWLVMDEADKLLDNQNEDFLESLNAELSRPRTFHEQDARERYLRSRIEWEDERERRLRKVILSATMTRDISKLAMLKLCRPQMIVVRGTEHSSAEALPLAENYGVKEMVDGYELPRTLVEYCVPVGDGAEKPLVAVELLRSRIFEEDLTSDDQKANRRAQSAHDEEDDFGSESDESSVLSSDDSSLESSDYGGSSDKDDGQSDNDSLEVEGAQLTGTSAKPQLSKASKKNRADGRSEAPTVLVFTSSNESASRLSHLLRGLKPDWSSRITTLLKVKPGKARIRAKRHEPAVVISTDRAARGLDHVSGRPITHVVQYDVPRSITGYVHRVGRTARAGRTGQAWTLYTHAEARWFVNEITKATSVKRGGVVERIKLFMEDEQLRQQYQKVLADMREDVFGGSS